MFKQPTKMHWLIWLGIILMALGTMFTIWGQVIMSNKSSESLEKKSDSIERLSNENINLSESNLKISQENNRLTQENLRLNQENLRISTKNKSLNTELKGITTGGESFCYLFPSPAFGKSTNTSQFFLNHRGDFPVYDLNIKIWDENCLDKVYEATIPLIKKKHFTLDEWKNIQNDTIFIKEHNNLQRNIHLQMQGCLKVDTNVPIVNPNRTQNIFDQPILEYEIPKETELNNINQNYLVNIQTRNGNFRQKILIQVQNRQFQYYSKVEKIISDSERITVREYNSVGPNGAIRIII